MTAMLLAPFFAEAALNASELDASGIAVEMDGGHSAKQKARSPIRSWSALRLPHCADDGLPYAL